MLKGKKKSMHPGPLGQLKPHENALLCYVFEQREQGIHVNTLSLVVKASSLSPEFNAKDFVVRSSAVVRFVHDHSLIYRMDTHNLQCKPDKVAAEASDYMDVMRRLVDGPHCDRRFILNMEQTPVYFTINAKRMLEMVRVNTVHVCTSTNDTKRAMVAVAITGSGFLLLSMVIFKGKPNGRITKTEFADYPTNHRYRWGNTKK